MASTRSVLGESKQLKFGGSIRRTKNNSSSDNRNSDSSVITRRFGRNEEGQLGCGLARPWAPPSYRSLDFDTLTLEGSNSAQWDLMRFSGTGQCAFLEANRQQMVASLPVQWARVDLYPKAMACENGKLFESNRNATSRWSRFFRQIANWSWVS